MSIDQQREWGGAKTIAPKAPRRKRNKYGAIPTMQDGIRFASLNEAKRYKQLLLLEQLGDVKNLRTQVPYELVPAVRFHDRTKPKPPLLYIADFVYVNKQGEMVIEDVKGKQTPEFKLKRHLMLALLGLHIRIIKAR